MMEQTYVRCYEVHEKVLSAAFWKQLEFPEDWNTLVGCIA
jgi:hypothetical protein